MTLSALRRTPVRRRSKAASGRPALSPADWRARVAELRDLAGGRCEVCPAPGRDPHHVKKRSAGGSDSLHNLVFLCRRCHDLTDAPLASPRGRLVIFPIMGGPGMRARWELRRAQDKWSSSQCVKWGIIERRR